EVRARGARQAQAILLGPGVRALVRPDAAGPISLDAHAAEEAAPRQPLAARAVVLLLVRPQRRFAVAHEGALQLPRLEQLARGLVGIRLALGQVDGDHIEGGALDQLRPLIGVDHVVGRRYYV